MQKQLQLRMDMAVFLQDTVKEMAKDIRSQHDGGADKSVNNLLKLLEDVGAHQYLIVQRTRMGWLVDTSPSPAGYWNVGVVALASSPTHVPVGTVCYCCPGAWVLLHRSDWGRRCPMTPSSHAPSCSRTRSHWTTSLEPR